MPSAPRACEKQQRLPGQCEQDLPHDRGQVEVLPGQRRVRQGRREVDRVEVCRHQRFRQPGVFLAGWPLLKRPRADRVRGATDDHVEGVHQAEFRERLRSRRPGEAQGDPQPVPGTRVIVDADVHEGGWRGLLIRHRDAAAGVPVPAHGHLAGEHRGVLPAAPHARALLAHLVVQRAERFQQGLGQRDAGGVPAGTDVLLVVPDGLVLVPPKLPARKRPPAVGRGPSAARAAGASVLELARVPGTAGAYQASDPVSDRRSRDGDLLAYAPQREPFERVHVVRTDDEGTSSPEDWGVQAVRNDRPAAGGRCPVQPVALPPRGLEVPDRPNRRPNAQYPQVRCVAGTMVNAEVRRDRPGHPHDEAELFAGPGPLFFRADAIQDPRAQRHRSRQPVPEKAHLDPSDEKPQFRHAGQTMT